MPPIKPTVLIQVDDAAPTTTTITNHNNNSNNGDAQTFTHAYAEAGRRVRISHAKSSCKSLRSASPSAIDYAISSNGTLEMEEEVLTQDHITNTGAVVSLTEVRYSSAMRAYRVYRQGQLGDPRSAPPHLRLLTATNLLLFTAVLGMLLSFVWSLNILPHVWVLAHIMEKERAAAMLRPDAGGMGLLAFLFWIACTSVLAYRVTSTLTDTMMEEVLAVRGVGLQITRYDLWHRVRSRHFVDLLMLRSLFIHDAFYRCQPIFFLSSSVENMPTRLVFFADTLPRLEVLRPVLVGLRHVLYGEADEGKSLAELEEVMMRRTPHSPLHVAGDSLRTEDSWGDDTTAVASELDTPTKDLS